jgi:carboxyl-terminal processing protease
MKQVVLDLKDNGGGLVGQAYRVANTFLSAGQTVFTQNGRLDGVTIPYRADNLNPETMPVVVLVNRNPPRHPRSLREPYRTTTVL